MRTSASKYNLPIFWLILAISFVHSSCQGQQSNLNNEDYSLFSQIINMYTIPPPPPPLSSVGKTETPKTIIDSLSKVKLKFGVYSLVKDDIAKNKSEEKLYTKCSKSLVLSIKSNDFFIDLNKIISIKGHKIVLVDNSRVINRKLFSNIDVLVRFSKPIYNDDDTRAFLEVSFSKGTLDGFLLGLCLKKENKKWVVVDSHETSMW